MLFLMGNSHILIKPKHGDFAQDCCLKGVCLTAMHMWKSANTAPVFDSDMRANLEGAVSPPAATTERVCDRQQKTGCAGKLSDV